MSKKTPSFDCQPEKVLVVKDGDTLLEDPVPALVAMGTPLDVSASAEKPKATVFSLTHEDGRQVDFHHTPGAETLRVVEIFPRRVEDNHLSRERSAALWKTLKYQGFKRF